MHAITVISLKLNPPFKILDLPLVTAHPHRTEDCATAIEQLNQQIINRKFGELLEDSCMKLREKGVDMKNFCHFLGGLFPPGDWIPESPSVDEVFDFITHHKLWDYWNFFPLAMIVDKYLSKDKEMKAKIETYKTDLASYKATTKIVDYIKIVASESSSDDSSEEQTPVKLKYNRRYYCKLSAKLDMKFTDHTLEYLDDIWKEFAGLFNLPSIVALLDCICERSILIVWYIQSHFAPQIFKTAPHSVDFYLKHHITRVEFDGVCIYPQAREFIEVCYYTDNY